MFGLWLLAFTLGFWDGYFRAMAREAPRVTLADGPFERQPAFRQPVPAEERALLQLIAVTRPAHIWVPPGVDRYERAWLRVLAKCEEWDLPPLMTLERLMKASALGLEPDW
jgi:hypothetical protein